MDPGGTALTYVSEQNGVHNVFRQPISGGPAQAITHFKEGRIQIHNWSPDGKRLLIIRWLDDFTYGEDSMDVGNNRKSRWRSAAEWLTAFELRCILTSS